MKMARTFIFRTVFLFLLFFTFSVLPTHAQDAAAGEQLYKMNCAACHKIDKKLVGPQLGGITEKRDQEWLIAWIRDNQALRESGDADAIAIYEEFSGSPMTPFPQFSDEDIINILAYTDAAWDLIQNPPAPVPGAEPVAAGGAADSGISLRLVLGVLSALLLIIVLVLVRLKNMLKVMQGDSTTNLVEDSFSFGRWYSKNSKLMMVTTIILAVISLNGAWIWLTAVGVDKKYQPEQPIAFSHELHAGQNQIDCNYCHSSARHSKTSGIPSANVCMNCHMYVSEGPQYGTEEIQKIYDAVGWDSEKQEYIEGYEQKPIKWIRTHNLPDLAYFNHSQHVTAGGQKCQTCHGPIEEMEEVYQYNDLTMGWCIDCHRETEVKMEGNEYYDVLHKQLAEKYKGEKITVEMIGGLECGKCHY